MSFRTVAPDVYKKLVKMVNRRTQTRGRPDRVARGITGHVGVLAAIMILTDICIILIMTED